MTNLIKRLNFCIWTQVSSKWADMEAWIKRCAKPPLRMEDFAGQECWLAFDLASKIDIAALIIVFRLTPEQVKKYGVVIAADRITPEVLDVDDEPKMRVEEQADAGEAKRIRQGDAFAVFGKYYLPAQTCDDEANEHYQQWAASGALTRTAGARTDFHVIEDDIMAINAAHNVKRLSYDPREATYLVQEIAANVSFECVEVTQSAAMLSQPMKELEALTADGTIIHNGDPVLSWMMGNVVKKEARGGGSVKYYFPAKEADAQKIDGVVSLIMALDGALRTEQAVDAGMVVLPG
jgi:phage terminase large subunit-like protein